MGDDITIGVTEIVNNIEVTAQPNDQIVDISVIDNADDVTLNITPTVIEINVNRGSSFAKWGTILGTLSDQTDLQDALDLKADLVDGKVPSSQLPSYVDDVIEVANYAALPATGETGKIYVTIDNNKIFRWTGSTYVEIIDSAAVWGAITGTLSSQTDLQNALNLKANDNAVVKLTGDQSITGSKSFTTNTAAPAMVVTNNSTDNGILLQNTSTGRGITSNNVSTGIGIRSDNTGGGTGISSSNTGAGTGIVSTNTSTTGSALSISNSSTGYGILLTNSTGTGISSSNTGSGTGFYSNNSSTGNGIQSINSSSGYGISSSNTGSGRGIYSSNNSTGDAINIANSGSGRGIYLTNASSGNSLILNNGTSATGIPFTVSKNGTDKFTINDAGEATGVKFIKSGGTSSQFLKADGSVDSSTYALTSQLHDAVTLGTTGVLNGLSLSGQVLSLATASSTTRGALTAEDYSYFFGKQNALTNPVTGTGTTNYIPKFTGASAIGNSLIYDNGTNVGIGTNSPDQKLTVIGNVRAGGVGNGFLLDTLGVNFTNGMKVVNNYETVMFSGRGSSGYVIAGDNNLRFGFGTNYSAGESMRITSGGNVGIGVTVPNAKLEVGGNAIFNSGLNSTDGIKIISSLSSSLFTGGIEFIRTTVSGGSKIQPLRDASAGGVGMSLLVTANNAAEISGTYSNAVTILPSGNVGIGTTSPDNGKLTILKNTSRATESSYGIAIQSNALNAYTELLLGADDTVDCGVIQTAGKNTSFTSKKLALQPQGGNVGIGTTSPSAKLEVVGGGIRFGNGTIIGELGYSSRAEIGTISNHNLGFTTNSITQMLITSGGNVGIGTTSPVNPLTVQSNGSAQGIAILNRSGDDFSNLNFYNYAGTSALGGIGNSSGRIRIMSGGVGDAYERLSITSGGNVGIGTTSFAADGINVFTHIKYSNFTLGLSTDSGSGMQPLRFLNGTTAVGSVTTTTSTTSYNIMSDYRLKQDFKQFNGLDLVSKIKVYDYEWKIDNSRMNGVIAHELQEVVPYAVTGKKDAEEMQSVDYSKLVPILVQAIQELKTEIEILKNK